jgi:hypothetical protein
MLRNLFAASLLYSSVLFAQNVTNTGKATASGTCAVSHSGNNDVISINNCGIGKQQADKIVEMLKAVLANQKNDERDSKLDEMVELARRPQIVINGPVQGNVAGINNGQQVFNQLGEPPTIKQVVAQIDTTCALKSMENVPQNAVMSAGSEDSYLSGPDTKEVIIDGAYTFTKPTSDGSVVATQKFSLQPTSPLVGTPTSSFFQKYNRLHILNYAVSGGFFKECTSIAVKLTVNGEDAMQLEQPISLAMDDQHGISFTIALTPRR